MHMIDPNPIAAPSAERRAPSAERRAPSAERRTLARVCAGLGIVLLVAAGFKGHSLLTDFVPGKTLLLSRFVQFATVEIELFLGLWLVSGLKLTWAARVGTAFFLALAGVSGRMLASGAEFCGCLGKVAVSPWFSFLFDLVAICALVLVPKPARSEEPSRPGVALALSSVFVFLALFLPIAGWKEPISASRSRTLGSVDELVLLDTENWPGQRLPVLDHINIGKELGRGGWTVIFYHRDCPKCEHLIKQAAELVHADKPLALIEVPPASGQAAEPYPMRRNQGFVLGRLSARRRWIIETPKVVRVEEGVVIRAGDGLDDGEISCKEKDR